MSLGCWEFCFTIPFSTTMGNTKKGKGFPELPAVNIKPQRFFWCTCSLSAWNSLAWAKAAISETSPDWLSHLCPPSTWHPFREAAILCCSMEQRYQHIGHWSLWPWLCEVHKNVHLPESCLSFMQLSITLVLERIHISQCLPKLFILESHRWGHEF